MKCNSYAGPISVKCSKVWLVANVLIIKWNRATVKTFPADSTNPQITNLIWGQQEVVS